MSLRSHHALALLLVLLRATVSYGQGLGLQPASFSPEMKPVVAHMKWMGRDGAPENIAALAQTIDGYLWLGTPLGLYRFDGLQFASYPMTTMEAKLPALDIDALTSDLDGGLWIGFRLSGGISHLTRDGVLTSYDKTNGRGPKSALKIVVRSDKSVWAIADNKLLVLRDDHWEDFGKAHGLPDEPLWSLFFDSHGNLWTSARQKLFVLHPGHGAFDLYPTKTFIIVDLAEAPDGQIWLSDGWRVIRPLEPNSSDTEIHVPSYTRTLIEPSGTMWMAQDYRGVSHFKVAIFHKPSSPLVEETDLSSEQTNSILRDRDGNIWVGTSRGLDRFQSSPLKSLRNTRVEYYPALAADAQSGVWIAMLAHPLVHASGDTLTAMGREIGSSPMVCDDQGRVWLVDPLFNMLTKYEGGRMFRFPVPDEIHRVPAQSIGLDYDGALLISFDEFGLWRFDGHWQQIHNASLPTEHPLTIFRDKERHVWLGYPDSRIAMRDEHGVHTFTTHQSADLGNVLTFAVSHDRLWAAGANGLAYLDHGAFRRVSLNGASVLRGTSGIVEDPSGSLWLNTSVGIVRIRASELNKLSHGPMSFDYDILDDRQGVEGTATQIKPTPSAVADKNGLLWFSMSGAIYSVDSEALSLRKSVPVLSLQNVSMNGITIMDREHAPTLVTTSAASLKELEIDYIGIDLSAPEKVSYQYMLEGEDKAWREVGNRRQAFYTYLRPGSYRFRVRASNGAAPWQEFSAPPVITITPAFYQTVWFYLLSAIVALTLLYLLYLLRVQYLTNLLKDRLKERSDERLRIARALHDTLLQSVHGLMLRFHFAAQTLPEHTPARQSLEVALVRADAVYLETRSQVESLRDEVAEGADLVSLIAKRAQEMEIQQRMTFQIVENGQRQALNGTAQAELYRIASEALTNTVLHARAAGAEVILTYGGSELVMKCCDTGVGLPPLVLATGQRTGHWGLIGMRERVATIGGRLQIWSSPGGGTEIEIRVPARRAYLYPSARLVWLQRLLQFRRTATGLDSEPEMES
ncbi:sensor histidine kinase [Terriglobus saanensis]|uniref:Histidine kinase n=1 Tax=Terriglobus saanensis (strain ATCC BAA-1853 / DSM 23119 / SP1PR4) TaxID=401053 RepID=E8V459_TERSS|nr:sensor histidine kinase [Terriglobus saanensis]ADV82550.1 histidine kinase [Terriglobus saanensis SP1PR4]